MLLTALNCLQGARYIELAETRAADERFVFGWLANRTSYVIGPDDKVIYEYTSLDPSKHVENTMAAVKSWSDAHHH